MNIREEQAIENQRPEGWENPYEWYKGRSSYSEYPVIFEAGASALIKAGYRLPSTQVNIIKGTEHTEEFQPPTDKEERLAQCLEPGGVRTPSGDLFRELADPEFRYHFIKADKKTQGDLYHLRKPSTAGWIDVGDNLPSGQWNVNHAWLSEEVLIANSCSVNIGFYNRLLVRVMHSHESYELPKYDLVEEVGNGNLEITVKRIA